MGGLPFTSMALLDSDLAVCRTTAIDLEGVGLGGKYRGGAAGALAEKCREGVGLLGGVEGNRRVRVLWRQKDTAGTTGPYTSTKVIPRGFPLR